MRSSYLDIAQQDKNARWRYIVVPTCALLVYCLITIAIILFSPLSDSIRNITDDSSLENKWPLLSPFIIALPIAFILSFRRFHNRSLLTLFTPTNTIHYRRTLIAFTVSLVISIPRYLMAFLITPSRYIISFNTTQWNPILYLFGVITLFISAIWIICIKGYFLQGLSLWIRNLKLLPLAIGLLSALASLIDNNYYEFSPFKLFLDSFLYGSFYTWIILKDDGLALFSGAFLNSRLIRSLVFGHSGVSPKLLNPIITILPPYNWAFNFVFTLMEYAIFYSIFFHRDILGRDPRRAE